MNRTKHDTNHGGIKRLMALMLTFTMVFGIAPMQLLAYEDGTAYASDGLSTPQLTLGNNVITFTPGNFPASYSADVGDTDVVFYMEVTVEPQSGFDSASSGGLSGIAPIAPHVMTAPATESPVVPITPPTDAPTTPEVTTPDGDDTYDDEAKGGSDEEATDDETPKDGEDNNESTEAADEIPTDETGSDKTKEENQADDDTEVDNATGSANILRTIATALGIVPVTVHASEYEDTASDIILTWYQDGQRRGDMGHTVIPNPRHSGLDPESPAVRVQLRFDTVWATDGGVWTLRGFYDGSQFVESPYSLDLTVAPLGIMPLNHNVNSWGGLGGLVEAVSSSGSGNVTLTGPITGTAQLTIERSLTLDLAGHALDITTGNNESSIYINSGITLTITDSGGTGNLNVINTVIGLNVSAFHTGINTAGATLIINGGTITAQGGFGGAGIGGFPDGGTIIIGGNASVTASGGSAGAGIGGSNGASTGGTITIGGNASVTAIGGGPSSAGIGGNNGGAGGTITIGGNAFVTATGGGTDGAGIGSGNNGASGGDITITGGTINAIGGTNAAGIGGGGNSAGGNINITGGTINATGGSAAPGAIGPGNNGTAGTISVTGGIFLVMNSTQLTSALTAIGNGTGTIRLGASFTHNTGIVISGGANITFDLNGFNLTVNNTAAGNAGHGMDVFSSGTVVNVTGTGTMSLNATGAGSVGLVVTPGVTVNLAAAATLNATSALSIGVNINGANSAVTVTNATGGNGFSGANATSNANLTVRGDAVASGTDSWGASASGGATIHVLGNATATGTGSIGAIAFLGGTVNVGGSVSGVGRGAFALGAGSEVNVTGNATATGGAGDGARAQSGGEVNVDGNAISTNDGFGAVASGNGSFVTVEGNASATGSFGIGAAAINNGNVVVRSNVSGELNGSFADNGTVIVEGNVTVTSAGGPGAEVLAGGNIRIDGTITAPIFARVVGVNRAQNSFNTPTTLAGYLTYDNRPTTPVTSVWVREPAPPSATIANTTIGNAGGNVVITLTNDTFAASLTNTTGWITNLPAGMTQTAARNSATQVTIAISGTPTAASTAQIAVTIPAAELVTSSTNLAVTANSSAVFATTVPTLSLNPTTATITTRSGAGSSATVNVQGTAAGAITFTNDTTPAWLNLTPNAGVNTIAVSLGAGVPTTAVNNNWTVTVNRQGQTAILTVAVNIPVANQAPIITTQPANQSVQAGNNATFTTVASGVPAPTFQWQVNTGSGWTNVAGATSATLTLTGVTLGMNGNQYRVVATNSQGSVNSNTATLTVTPVPHIPVTSITGVNTSDMIAGQSRTLTGTASPANATSQTITWSIQNARTTGATITGNTLRTVSPGTVTIAAIVANGIAPGVHFTQHFNINVTPAHIPVTNIIDIPTTTTMGVPLLLTGIVIPANATSSTIFWSVQSQGTTGATITDNTLHTTEAGTAIIRATISNGTAPGVAFIRNFAIIVTPLPALTAPPTITGPTTMSLTTGYTATFTEAFTVTGSPIPAVALNVTPATDLITWNNAENRIDIGAGLATGTYTIRLTAVNGVNPNAIHTVTLVVAPSSGLNGWHLIDGNLVFYRNGVRVGQGQAGSSGKHFAQNLITPGGIGDFLFNNQGHLLTGLRSYGGEWHYFHTTHGTRLLSAVSGWWGWQLAPGQLRYLHADGTWAEDELITITWDCNYGGPSQAGYLFDADGFLVTDFDFDLAGGLSVHSAFGEWHVMATHSFNRIGNFNEANGGGWIQPRPGTLRYLIEDGTYVAGPASVVGGRVTVPADRITDAWTVISGNEFLFCEDGYLQFGWVYVDGHRVAYIDGSGIRVVD